ncbi:MAG TPA: type IV secretion system DNA-binding domain-containing protein, partial [Patescibacteria group bacterium]|nr:type IV secretion system DNA-binding domain-containing protein [Patescibacteria group bacterium]
MPDEENQITVFAKTNFRNKEVPFGIKTDDRRRHMYLIGKTGMGKTTMMENMVIQDIRNGHGVAFLDPHGDSIQRILNSIPNNRVNDVIYFNPADLDYPVAFNILESVDQKFKHLVASGLMGVFTKIWANLWSARMEYILNNTILALLDSPGNTLLGITRMYVDKKYRKKIVDNIKDPMVKAFWTDEFANYNEKYRTEAIAPIQNKVGQFLSSGIIRNIVGQPRSTIDLREIMDKQKILIMDLSKGKVGEDNSALLGAMLVTKLQLAAMSRTDIPEAERKDFYLYVDEFQNFATDSFATILSEARKYRLNLIIGHQYIGQLVQDRNTKVRDAIFGNVGTLVVFRVGAEDAEYLVKEFEPIFTEVDIVNLPKYQILLKLMINGVASDPFSAITLPPNPRYLTGNSEKTIKVSRERFSNPVAEVEDKISRWMGAEFHQESAVLIGEEEAAALASAGEYVPMAEALPP